MKKKKKSGLFIADLGLFSPEMILSHILHILSVSKKDRSFDLDARESPMK